MWVFACGGCDWCSGVLDLEKFKERTDLEIDEIDCEKESKGLKIEYAGSAEEAYASGSGVRGDSARENQNDSRTGEGNKEAC